MQLSHTARAVYCEEGVAEVLDLSGTHGLNDGDVYRELGGGSLQEGLNAVEEADLRFRELWKTRILEDIASAAEKSRIASLERNTRKLAYSSHEAIAQLRSLYFQLSSAWPPFFPESSEEVVTAARSQLIAKRVHSSASTEPNTTNLVIVGAYHEPQVARSLRYPSCTVIDLLYNMHLPHEP